MKLTSAVFLRALSDRKYDRPEDSKDHGRIIGEMERPQRRTPKENPLAEGNFVPEAGPRPWLSPDLHILYRTAIAGPLHKLSYPPNLLASVLELLRRRVGLLRSYDQHHPKTSIERSRKFAFFHVYDM